MKTATRYGIYSMAANVALALVCVGLFAVLPFPMVANAVLSAFVWIVGGFFIDRWHLSRLSNEDRAEEMRRRADSDL